MSEQPPCDHEEKAYARYEQQAGPWGYLRAWICKRCGQQGSTFRVNLPDEYMLECARRGLLLSVAPAPYRMMETLQDVIGLGAVDPEEPTP